MPLYPKSKDHYCFIRRQAQEQEDFYFTVEEFLSSKILRWAFRWRREDIQDGEIELGSGMEDGALFFRRADGGQATETFRSRLTGARNFTA